MRRTIPLLAACALSACAQVPLRPSTLASAVVARGETVPVGTGGNVDAADDPAIWRNPADPVRSLIVATDKKAGLHVYGLDGKSRYFAAAGLVNNVDLLTLRDGRVLVAASDRNDILSAKLRLYWLKADGALVPYGTVDGGQGEGYGLCLWDAGDAIYAFSVVKDGRIRQVRLDLSGSEGKASIVREMRVPTQAEGCVVDPRSEALYIGEEDVGILRFAAGADEATEGRLVASVDGKHLVADVEGLTLAPAGKTGGFLIASSQGDHAFAVYSLPDLIPAGRFRIIPGTIGGAEETDGIALELGDFGPSYRAGMFVAQDGFNKPAQNFKLVAWEDILAALASD